MSDDNIKQTRIQGLRKLIQRYGHMPTQAVLWASALGSALIYTDPNLPQAFVAFAGAIGVGKILNVLDRYGNGENVPEEEIQAMIQVLKDSDERPSLENLYYVLERLDLDNEIKVNQDTMIGMLEELLARVTPSVKLCPTAPRPPAHFVGRIAEIDKLFTNLGDGGTVAITAVRGVGGMGKTTLAQALCHHDESPFNAVFWADITPNPEASSHLQSWARYANPDYTLPAELTPAQLAQEADRISTLLTAHVNEHCGTTLVVFDDVWENGVATVKLLQRAMPHTAQVLITTRSEKVVNLLNAQKDKLSLEELPDDDAEKLLRELTDGNKYLTDAHIQRTVDLLQGHPLALEIAAESLNVALDTNDIDGILDDYDTGIKHGTRFDAMDLDADEIKMPRSLNAVFQRTYDNFDQTQQKQFRAFGILAPESVFNRELLGHIWELEEPKDINTVIRYFNGRALVKQDADSTQEYDDTYYTQHALLRTYARALLLREKDMAEYWETLALYTFYAITQAQQFNALPLEQWAQLDPFLSHLHEVGDKLVGLYQAHSDDETINQVALGFANVTRWYLYRRPENVFVDGQLTRHTWLEIGLKASEKLGDKKQQSLFLGQLAVLHSTVGNKQKSLEYNLQALPINQGLGDKKNEAALLNNIGDVYLDLGDKKQALNYFQQTLPISQQVGDKIGEATTLNNIGGAYFALGDKQQALNYFQQALSIQQQVGDRSSQATALNNIGGVYQDLGDLDKAIEYLQQGLQIRQQIGDKFGEVISYFNIGMIYNNQGKFDEAIPYVQRAVDLGTQVSSPRMPMFQQRLAQIQQMATGQAPSEEEQHAQILQMLLTMYAEKGEEGVRQYLSEQGLPNEAIDSLVAQIQQAQAQQQLIDTYKTEGEEAVKVFLKELGIEDDAIEGVLAQLRQMDTDS